jgi:cbb3-type cytochrome oxidase maturation protein
MTASLFILLPVSLLFVVAMGAAFWWAIFAGQFDNADAAGESILRDDDTTPPGDESNTAGAQDVESMDAGPSP